MFTGNKHTVHIPVIETSVSTGTANRSRSSHLFANTHGGRIDRHIESGSFGSDHMDNDGANVLTSSRGSSFHLVSLVTGNIADRHHEGGTADSEIGFTGFFPSVGDVLVGPTIQVSVKNNRGTRTYIIFRSGELQVGTELINGEVGSSRATSFGFNSQVVSTRSVSVHLIDTLHRRSGSGLRPIIGSAFNHSSGQDVFGLTVADYIVTRNVDSGGSLSFDCNGLRLDCAAIVIRVDGFHINIVSTLSKRGVDLYAIHTSSGSHELSIHIPFVSRSTEFEICNRSMKFVTLQREGKLRTSADGLGSSFSKSESGSINSKFVNFREIFSNRIGSTCGRRSCGSASSCFCSSIGANAEIGFHRPSISQISIRNRECILSSGGKKDTILEPLPRSGLSRLSTGGTFLSRLGTIHQSNVRNQLIHTCACTSVFGAGERDSGNAHHHERMNRRHHHRAVSGRHFHSELVSEPIVKSGNVLRLKLVGLLVVGARGSLTINLPEVADGSIHGTIHHSRQRDVLIRATHLGSHNRYRKHLVGRSRLA